MLRIRNVQYEVEPGTRNFKVAIRGVKEDETEESFARTWPPEA